MPDETKLNSDDQNTSESERDDESSDDESAQIEYEMEDHNSNNDEHPTAQKTQTKSPRMNPNSTNEELCIFDLRNLLAMNGHQVDVRQLYPSNKNSDRNLTTIQLSSQHEVANEQYLLQKAVTGCSQLINAIWNLPVEPSSAGPLVHLPAYDESKIPRALPLPQPKKDTKWEKFAKEKGIGVNKEKRSRQVWDEATGTWMFRHGYQKANDNFKEHPIIEVNEKTDNPFDDPWEKLREKKNNKLTKETKKHMLNLERSGSLEARTTKRFLPKPNRNVASNDNPPPGVPVDLKNASKRGKESTVKALIATQRSTASIGVFDKIREGEPDRRKSTNKSLKKRKSNDPTTEVTEHERSLKVMKTVMKGGVKQEKDRKKGLLASGETAFDYQFNDGLEPSSFKKRKGRAGAGKLTKMTKKRIK